MKAFLIAALLAVTSISSVSFACDRNKQKNQGPGSLLQSDSSNFYTQMQSRNAAAKGISQSDSSVKSQH